ncbi:MAG: 2-oxoacid:acceptor oxidoreductase family protein [Caldisericota bacterium]|nr:2-oxoacid:acceptor oxidoreductase family protein [Caldisericota bacterium]
MEHNVVIAGFGGQGVMLVGELLAHAGMDEGKEVTWLPSYGPEQRGGTANCAVVVADEPIASPLLTEPQSAIVFNRQSFDKFAPLVAKGGLLIVDSTLVESRCDRSDIETVYIPATDIASELGNSKFTNMVLLGVYLSKVGPVRLDSVFGALEVYLTGKKSSLIEVNRRAIQAGIDYVMTKSDSVG